MSLMEKPNIYFDNAATTPPLNIRAQDGIIYNPSSPHKPGIAAERILYNARKSLAGLFGISHDIIFTSGGTEANNLALLGWVMANKRYDITVYAPAWEHPSVTEPLRFIRDGGLAHTEEFSDLSDLPQMRGGSRCLVSLSHISHETGDINDIVKVAKSLKAQQPDTIIHVDGVQGFCKERADFRDIDMYSFSGHKCHGSLGVGGVVFFREIRLMPLMYGGGQERGLRPGTENVPGIIQTVQTAANLCENLDTHHDHVSAIKARIASLCEELPDVYINSRTDTVSPYILNMSFTGIKGETLVHLLSEKGVHASMGAACRSRKKATSLLELMGFAPKRAQSAVRFSFSHLNTLEEADIAREIIINCVNQLRKVFGR